MEVPGHLKSKDVLIKCPGCFKGTLGTLKYKELYICNICGRAYPYKELIKIGVDVNGH